MTFIEFADEPSQEERINKLRAELEKLGGNTSTLESMPADMEEEFLRHVLEYETAEQISLLRLLENAGLEVPAPETLDDDALSIIRTISRIASSTNIFTTMRYVKRRCCFPRIPATLT
jgi:hypothetical protein